MVVASAGPAHIAVVSLDGDEGWVAMLRRACGHALVPLTWSQAVERGRDGRRGRLTLLDSATPRSTGELESYVRSLALVTHVVVSTAQEGSSAALLTAGAVNVLDRNALPGVLGARLGADLRWLRRIRPVPTRDGDVEGEGEGAPSFRTQALLLEVLCALPGPVCCHDIRRLLGAPGRLMTLPALRGRIQRLGPHLAERGLACGRTVRWGADTITVHAPGVS
ncbi:hypothetical protein [Streptomyces sp. NPDC058579]|uniref:hypothetical protein n=1 Tax=Streptomyces sp. NPDC058579 TaxID=3346548 RepID=UPI0036681BCE